MHAYNIIHVVCVCVHVTLCVCACVCSVCVCVCVCVVCAESAAVMFFQTWVQGSVSNLALYAKWLQVLFDRANSVTNGEYSGLMHSFKQDLDS